MVEFYDHHFSFPENFHGDYQFVLGMSFARIYDILEVQLFRFLLVEKAYREIHSRTIQ